MARFNDWTIGSDTGNGIISKIYHKKIDGFLIYEINDSGWFLFDSVGDLGKQFSEIQSEWTDVTNLLIENNAKKRYVMKMAGVLKESLLGNNFFALKKLESIRKSVVNYKQTIGRIVYWLGAFSLALLLIIFTSLLYYFSDLEYVFFNSMIFGMLGGLLSVSINLKKIDINIISGNHYIHFILGAIRIIISLISSIIILFLVNGGFLLSNVDLANEYAVFSLSVVSGFSEAFIPNLLNRVKDGSTKEIEV